MSNKSTQIIGDETFSIKAPDKEATKIQDILQCSLASLLLNGPIFNDAAFNNIKEDREISSLEQLLDAFYKDKDAQKSLLMSAIRHTNNKNNRIQRNSLTLAKQAEKKLSVSASPSSKPLGWMDNKLKNFTGTNLKNRDNTPKKNPTLHTPKSLRQKKTKVPKKKSSLKPMSEEQMKQFVEGSLPRSSVQDPDFRHKMLYFAFPSKSETRTIGQVKQFFKLKKITNKEYAWIELIKEGKLLEITCYSQHASSIIHKIGSDLVHKQSLDPTKYFDDPKEWKVSTTQKSRFAERLLDTADVLEKLRIRKHLSKFYRAFSMRITNVCVDEMDTSVSSCDEDIGGSKRHKGAEEGNTSEAQSDSKTLTLCQ